MSRAAAVADMAFMAPQIGFQLLPALSKIKRIAALAAGARVPEIAPFVNLLKPSRGLARGPIGKIPSLRHLRAQSPIRSSTSLDAARNRCNLRSRSELGTGSSAVERLIYTQLVGGSIPSSCMFSPSPIQQATSCEESDLRRRTDRPLRISRKTHPKPLGLRMPW